MRRFAPFLALATITLIAGAMRPALAADPCSGGLNTSQIVSCLNPSDLTGATRGIRPTAPAAPGGVHAASAPATAPQGAAVNLAVLFAFNSAELTPQGIAALDALGAALKTPALANAKFQIAGHTDAVGAPDYNLQLSERRATATRAYLTAHGIDVSRLSTVGYGETQLYDPAHPDAATNRRVQIIRLEN